MLKPRQFFRLHTKFITDNFIIPALVTDSTPARAIASISMTAFGVMVSRRGPFRCPRLFR